MLQYVCAEKINLDKKFENNGDLYLKNECKQKHNGKSVFIDMKRCSEESVAIFSRQKTLNHVF